jgi:hypothetical protein
VMGLAIGDGHLAGRKRRHVKTRKLFSRCTHNLSDSTMIPPRRADNQLAIHT